MGNKLHELHGGTYRRQRAVLGDLALDVHLRRRRESVSNVPGYVFYH